MKDRIREVSSTSACYIWLLMEILLFSVTSGYIKFSLSSIDIYTLTAWRYLFFGAIVLVLYSPQIMSRQINILDEVRLAFSLPYTWREICSLVSGLFWFSGLTLMPLALATTLFFARAPFLAVYGVFVLGERATLSMQLAVLIGFLGVVIATRPDVSQINIGIFLIISSAILSTFSSAALKSFAKTTKVSSIILRVSILTFPPSLIFLIYMQKLPNTDVLIHIFVLSLLFGGSIFSMVHGYKLAGLTIVAPLEFLRLVGSAVVGLVAFNEAVGLSFIVGSAMILAGNLLIVARK